MFNYRTCILPIFCKNRKTLAYTFIHKYDNVESECQPVKQVIFLLSEKSSFHLRKSQFSWIKWLEEVYFLHNIFDKENGADFNMWLFNCCMKIMLSSKYQWIPLYINSFHLVIVLWVLVWSYGLHFFYLTVTNLYSTCVHVNIIIASKICCGVLLTVYCLFFFFWICIPKLQIFLLLWIYVVWH